MVCIDAPRKIRSGVFFLLAVAAKVVLASGVAHAEKKVTVCHRPPGNPENPQTILVGEPAVNAHLAHGDALGACISGCQGNPVVCDDGNVCTTDSCAASGQCVHAAVSCDDGNACTLDACDAGAGCLAVPNNGVACDDGNACTSGDRCAASACRGSAIAGCCLLADDCDDGNPCTVESCAGGFCRNQPRDCAVADKCAAGFCGRCQYGPWFICKDGPIFRYDRLSLLFGREGF